MKMTVTHWPHFHWRLCNTATMLTNDLGPITTTDKFNFGLQSSPNLHKLAEADTICYHQCLSFHPVRVPGRSQLKMSMFSTFWRQILFSLISIHQNTCQSAPGTNRSCIRGTVLVELIDLNGDPL